MRLLSQAWHVCSGFLHLSFIFLCARFLIAAGIERNAPPGPAIAISIAAFCLGYSAPRAGLFAVMVATPILGGLTQSVLLICPSPPVLIFSAFSIGQALSSLIKCTKKRKCSSPRAEQSQYSVITILIVETFALVIVASLIGQILRHLDDPELHSAITGRSSFAFGDRYYFMTSAFVWLQGVYFFKLLCQHPMSPRPWTQAVFLSYVYIFIYFFLIQWMLRIPTPYKGEICFLPCEDISSFGSIISSLLIYHISINTPASKNHRFLKTCLGIVLLSLLVLSWSRAAWLAAMVVLLIFSWTQVSRKWTILLLIAFSCTTVLMNALPESIDWEKHYYLFRLRSLVRIENIANKDRSRLSLYIKAIDMIKARPVTGHGIGSFYMKSVDFARPEDPFGKTMDFAHNTVLQVAAEVGAPAAILFIFLTVSLISFAFSAGKKERKDSSLDYKTGWALNLALLTYILTQMTANSLNVYPSNQFFFWGCVGILFSINFKHIKTTYTARQH